MSQTTSTDIIRGMDTSEFQVLSDATIKYYLRELGADSDVGNTIAIRRLIAFAIRVYLVKHGPVTTERIEEIISAIGKETLGHTRAD